MKKIIHSFTCAFRGIGLTFNEKHMRFHLFAGLLAIFLGFLLSINQHEWLSIIIVIGMVLTAETFNTAIEDMANKIRDGLSLSYDATRNMRDISAGAVMFSALTACIVGFMVFGDKLLKFVVSFF